MTKPLILALNWECALESTEILWKQALQKWGMQGIVVGILTTYYMTSWFLAGPGPQPRYPTP